MMPKPLRAMSLIAVSLAVGFGCGQPATVNSPAVFQNNALQEIGELYRSYTEIKKKPPQSLRDFDAYSEGYPSGHIAAQRGEVVVLWGAKLDDLSEAGTNDSPDEVLAYLKEVPEKGGLVLMKNRKIKSMTAEEFKAAPKAGTASSAGGKTKAAA